MDLQTFVAETLRQIVGGVADAQKSVAALGTNARINPALISQTAKVQSGDATPVEFDVAITVVDDAETVSTASASSSSGMIAVVHADRTADAGTTDRSRHRSEAVSRVRFTVQLAQPSDIQTYDSSGSFASAGRRQSYAPY
ncbi:MAG: hypothetical protein PGN16_17350 [Sphingomonas phyllosphaerae]|uniref:hypothetical protein n=1 Tax=Sphingomonas phyllosphaerae TaxID=257003 RepID=UPI002FF7604D